MSHCPPDQLEQLEQLDYAALATFRFELRRFLAFSQRAAQAAGLEPEQHQLLLGLRGLAQPDRAPSIGQVAEWLHIQHHSAVELVDRAVARGLVQRTRDLNDRRRVLVEITPAGRAVLARLSVQHRQELESRAPALIDALQAVLAPLSEGQPA